MDWTEKAVILWVTNWLLVCFFEEFLYDFIFLKIAFLTGVTVWLLDGIYYDTKRLKNGYFWSFLAIFCLFLANIT